MVEGEVVVQLGPRVTYTIQGLKLIQHPHPIILIGSDILTGGRVQGQWNYTGLKFGTDS